MVLTACLRQVSCCTGRKAGVAMRLSQADTEPSTAQLTFAELADTSGLSVALPAVLSSAMKELHNFAVSLHMLHMPRVAQAILSAIMFVSSKQLLRPARHAAAIQSGV